MAKVMVNGLPFELISPASGGDIKRAGGIHSADILYVEAPGVLAEIEDTALVFFEAGVTFKSTPPAAAGS